jgi:hypothetical protein
MPRNPGPDIGSREEVHKKEEASALINQSEKALDLVCGG